MKAEQPAAERSYVGVMTDDVELPAASSDERELLLSWLGFLRGAVLRNLDGVSDADARWRPDDKLISLLGIVNHLTNVEWRWIDGGFLGADVNRLEAEFSPGAELTVDAAAAAYRTRASSTESTVRSLPSLQTPCQRGVHDQTDLRWVLVHLINETARHAGHADAVRELLDGTTGE